jgi:hypothetical protein
MRPRSHRNLMLLAVVTLGLVVSSSPARAVATLVGDVINCVPGAGLGGLTIAPSATVIDPGVEFTLSQPGTPLFNFDFGPSSLKVTCLATNNISGGAFITFSDLDWIGAPAAVISSLVIVPGSAVLTPAKLSFTNDSITINLGNASWPANATATINIVASGDPTPVARMSWGSVKARFR